MASTIPQAPVADKDQQYQQQLPGFERLSKLVYLYRPESQDPPIPRARNPSAATAATAATVVGDVGSSSSLPSDGGAATSSPKLILLGGWMDAREAHLAKYTTKYQALFPGTPILLVRSFVYHFTPGRHRARDFALDIAPAVSIIQSLTSSGSNGDDHDEVDKAKVNEPTTPRILIHVFSNGGSTMLRHLYTLCNNNNNSNIPGGGGGSTAVLPPRVTIFDSAPGRFQYSRSIYAFSLGVPFSKTPLFKFLLIKLAIHLLCASYWVFQVVLRRRGYLDQTFALHNDPEVKRGGIEVRRTYIYSREDRMVDFHDVEEHAAEARRKGVVAGEVRVERFEGTAHVAHVRGDEDRYWKVVKESWEGKRS